MPDETLRLYYSLCAYTCLQFDLVNASADLSFAEHKGHYIDFACTGSFLIPGRFIVSGSEDKSLRLWEITNGECIRKLDGHMDTINCIIWKVQSKIEGKDQESIQSSTTPDSGYQWESDNFTIRHHKREPRGQPFPSR